MGSRLWWVLGAALFVVVGVFLFLGDQRDDGQDKRITGLSQETGKLADATTQNAEATKVLAKAVGDLSADAQADEQRLSKLEGQTSELRERVQLVEDDIQTREAAKAYSFIASDLSIAGMAKVAVAEAIMSNGSAPGTNAEAGLPSPADMRGQSLRATYVQTGGRIVLEYDRNSGVDGGTVRLVPDVPLALRTGILNWRCESDDYADIEAFLPNCKYVGTE
jgi:hypothetical protein